LVFQGTKLAEEWSPIARFLSKNFPGNRREKMDGKLEVSLDKLPVKRLDAIEENGFERFPSYGSFFPLLKPPFSFRENVGEENI